MSSPRWTIGSPTTTQITSGRARSKALAACQNRSKPRRRSSDRATKLTTRVPLGDGPPGDRPAALATLVQATRPRPAGCRRRRAGPRGRRGTRRGRGGAASGSGSRPGRTARGRAARWRWPTAASGSRPGAASGPASSARSLLVGVEVVVEEVDQRERPGRRPGRRGSSRGPAERPTTRSIGPGPACLEDFPAAVGVAEAALERARPGHGLLAGDAADAEDSGPRGPARPRPASARGARRCGSRTSTDNPAAAPASRPPPRAGRGNEAQPRAHGADLGPWGGSSRGDRTAISGITRRSGRTPCWRRPCGGRSRGG